MTALEGAGVVAYYFISYSLAVGGLLIFPKNDESTALMRLVVIANVTVIISPVLLIFWGICIASMHRS